MQQTSVTLSVRWWRDRQEFAYTPLALDPATTAFVLVDCDGTYNPASYDHVTKVEATAPALQAARRARLRVVFYNAPGGEGGPRNISRELHGLREGKDRSDTPAWKPQCPTYYDQLQPLAHEAEFQKAHRNGFRDTFADQYLRTWNIDTLIMAGFSLKSCLYHICIGAHEHNYRVIVLRGGVCPPGAKEFPDTLDQANAERGWTRFVLLRLIETNTGYTSTAAEWRHACQQA